MITIRHADVYMNGKKREERHFYYTRLFGVGTWDFGETMDIDRMIQSNTNARMSEKLSFYWISVYNNLNASDERDEEL